MPEVGGAVGLFYKVATKNEEKLPLFFMHPIVLVTIIPRLDFLHLSKNSAPKPKKTYFSPIFDNSLAIIAPP